MRHKAILFWFLCIVLKTAVSTILLYPVGSELLPKLKLKKVYIEGNEKHWAYIGKRTTTSITINIRLENNTKYKLLGAEVRYRPSHPVITPASLKWNQTMGYYVANQSFADWKILEVGHFHFRESALTSPEKEITISNLRFPSIKYKFILTYHLEENYRKTEVIEASAVPVIPSAPPKTGAGCFHVYEVADTKRFVKVYWQLIEDDADMEYKVSVYEDGNSTAVYRGGDFMMKGFIWISISLRRHYFFFRACNRAGCSENSAIVQVPDQNDILPALWMRIFQNLGKNTWVLYWKPPSDIKITNYTVFWYDKKDSSETSIAYLRDFVYLGNGGNVFEVVDGDFGLRSLELAVSVNTELMSSGLHRLKYTPEEVWSIK